MGKKDTSTAVFILMAVIFSIYAFYLAVHLQPEIIPDEPAHFVFSKHFSTTWGIPPDTMETSYWGWYIQQNPFLYHWLNGRLINLISAFEPLISDQEILIFLRVVNVFFSIGTITYCYLMSVEVIKHKWWQLLPVFLLTNTLMFVFLAGGLNYDNLANLLSFAGIYYLIKAFRKKDFIKNSIAWICCIAIGTIVKYTILPLALIMSFSWLFYLIINKNKILPLKFPNIIENIILGLALFLIAMNFAIYGVNLLRYQSIRPECSDILDEKYCDQNIFVTRHQQLALENKLTLLSSINSGYPNPIEYISNTWIRNLLIKTYGVLGHKIYYPFDLINGYQFLFYLIMIFGILFWKPSSYLDNCLVAMIVFYGAILLFTNYRSELVYGFKHIAIQGRYIFPVIGPIYIIFTKILKATPSKYLRWAILIFTIGLFIYGGPLTLILKYDTVFSSWFH